MINDQIPEERIRLVLLDGFELFRVCLGRLLGSVAGLEVAAECGTSAEALEVLKGSTVDVVLLDSEAGAERGNDFMSSARQAGFEGRFLVVAGAANARDSAIALKLGASGIFLKTEGPDQLVQAIRHVRSGGIWVDRRTIGLLTDQLTEPDRIDGGGFSRLLEDRERNVLRGIAAGLTNRKIGGTLGITESAVKNVVQRLFGKAGVKTRSQLVRATLEGSFGPADEFIGRPAPETSDRRPQKFGDPWKRPDTNFPATTSHQ